MKSPGGAVVLAALLFGGADSVSALNETPAAAQALRWEPYAFHLEPNGYPFTYVARDCQHYDAAEFVQETPDECPTTTLSQFVHQVGQGGHGLIFICSHGAEDGFAVEAYDSTAIGWQARHDAFLTYLAFGYQEWTPGFPGGQIWEHFVGFPDGTSYYDICVRPDFVASIFDSRWNTLVYNASCYSNEWADSAWPGARCALGYNGVTYTYPGDVDTFWGRMNGESGWYFRDASHARLSTTLQLSGFSDGRTVLSPVVLSVVPAAESNIDGSSLATMAFNARMNTSVVPAVDGMDAVYTSNVAWASDSTLAFKINSQKIGWGRVRVAAASATAAGLLGPELDGNQDPSGSNGMGPNGDDYEYKVYSIRQGGPAARVSGRYSDDGIVSWFSEEEVGTLGYRVLGAEDLRGGPWVSVSEEIPARGGGSEYKTTTHGDWPWALLQEREDGGGNQWKDVELFGRSVGDREGNDPAAVLSADLLCVHVVGVESQRAEIEEYVASKRAHGFAATYEIAPSITRERVDHACQQRDCLEIIWHDPVVPRTRGGERGIEDQVLIIAPEELETAVDAYANELSFHGFPASRINVQYIDYPATHDSAYVGMLTKGVEPVIILIGDVVNRNDPSYDVAIPLPYVYDPNYHGIWSSGGGSYDFALSLWDYEKNDWAPGIAKCVGYLPAYDNACVYRFLQKMAAAYWNGFYSGYGSKVGAWGNDLDSGINPGEAVREAMEAVVDSLRPQWDVDEYYTSDLDTQTARYAHVIESLVEGRSIVAMLATGSDHHNPCMFLHMDLNYDTLEGTWKLTHFLPLSCMTQPVDRLNCDMCSVEKLLWLHQGGALTSIGPTRAYYAPQNFHYLREYFRQLDAATGPISVGELHRGVREALLEEDPGDTLMEMYCKITVLLGDPTIPVYGPLSDSLSGVRWGEGAPPGVSVFLGAARPNPFNPSTTIPFTLSGASKVDLSVYNVAGRLVRVLVRHQVPGGSHEIVWDGTTQAGYEAGSGVYLYRLEAGKDTATKRMVLVR